MPTPLSSPPSPEGSGVGVQERLKDISRLPRELEVTAVILRSFIPVVIKRLYVFRYPEKDDNGWRVAAKRSWPW